MIKYTIYGKKKHSDRLIKKINSQLSKDRLAANRTSNYDKQINLEANIASYEGTIEGLRSGDQAIYNSFILVEVSDSDKKALASKVKRLKQDLRQFDVFFNSPLADYKDAWRIKSPLSIKPEKSDLYKDMLSFTLAAGWGFSNSQLKDEKGMILGHNHSGAIYWDPNMTNDDFQKDHLGRMNLNALIVGGSGSGKSTLTQKIVNWDNVTGQSVWVVDPKDEDYFGLSDSYDGKIFEFGINDGKNRLNPFEILGWSRMTIEERKQEITAHGEFLDGWLMVLFNDTKFKNQIIAIYKEYYQGKEKTEKMKWLTFSKIEKIFEERGEEYGSNIEMFSMFSSPDHFYNGDSTVSNLFDEDFVVFQTTQVFRTPNENLKNASLILLLQLITTKAKLNRTSGKRFHAIIDEAHNFFNTKIGKLKVEQLVREARGWASGVILISQNPQDFMGSGITNNITTSFYGALDTETTLQLSHSLSATPGKEGLNNIEKDFILNASRGQFLVVLNGKEKITLQVKMNPFEFDAIKGELTNKSAEEKDITSTEISKNIEAEELAKEVSETSSIEEIIQILSREHDSEELSKFSEEALRVLYYETTLNYFEIELRLSSMRISELTSFVDYIFEYNFENLSKEKIISDIVRSFDSLKDLEKDILFWKKSLLIKEGVEDWTKDELIELFKETYSLESLQELTKDELIELGIQDEIEFRK